MVNLKPILRSIQRSFEAYDLMILWIAAIPEQESRLVCIMSLKRQLEAMRRELDELEDVCLQELRTEQEYRYEALVSLAKVLRAQYPVTPGCGYSNQDLTLLREEFAKVGVETEMYIEKYFRFARKKLFQLSVSARAL